MLSLSVFGTWDVSISILDQERRVGIGNFHGVHGGSCHFLLHTPGFYLLLCCFCFILSSLFHLVDRIWPDLKWASLLARGDSFRLFNETHVYTEETARFIHGHGTAQKQWVVYGLTDSSILYNQWAFQGCTEIFSRGHMRGEFIMVLIILLLVVLLLLDLLGSEKCAIV